MSDKDLNKINWNQIHASLLKTSKPYPKLNKLISDNKKIEITYMILKVLLGRLILMIKLKIIL